jgi:hypothetical protein
MSDLIAYGARCTWWDSKDRVGLRGDGIYKIPCCPFCGNVLFEMSEVDWSARMKTYEAAGHPGYADMITWARGKCFMNLFAMTVAYERERKP